MRLGETYLARALNALEVKRGAAPSETRVLRANSSFASASIIGLADLNHGDPSGVIKAASIVEQYAKPGDFLLLEGVARGINYLNSIGVQVAGWDDMEEHEK